jgi:ABC-type nitrate/sulfonate/bicarbonate transport system permease component
MRVERLRKSELPYVTSSFLHALKRRDEQRFERELHTARTVALSLLVGLVIGIVTGMLIMI